MCLLPCGVRYSVREERTRNLFHLVHTITHSTMYHTHTHTFSALIVDVESKRTTDVASRNSHSSFELSCTFPTAFVWWSVPTPRGILQAHSHTRLSSGGHTRTCPRPTQVVEQVLVSLTSAYGYLVLRCQPRWPPQQLMYRKEHRRA